MKKDYIRAINKVLKTNYNEKTDIATLYVGVLAAIARAWFMSMDLTDKTFDSLKAAYEEINNRNK